MTVRYLRLAEVCEINPRLPRTHGLVDDDEVSFVPMAAVDEVSGVIKSAEVRRYVDVKKGYTAFSDGDVLFAKITPCMENGKAALADELVGGRGFGSTEFHVLRAGDQVIAEWLRYFVRREVFRHDAKRNFTGTAGQQRVPTSFLQNVLIPVPSRAEQQRVVDQLSRAEGIVRLRRQAQQKAAELIPAIFADMFGDPATNPKGWPANRLRDLVDFQSGGTPSKARDDYWQGDVPWVSPKDMKRLALYDAIDHISSLVLAETSLKLVPAGSVLIVVRGMILAHTVPVAEARVPLTVNQDMKALISKGAIHSTYLLWMLQVCHDRLLSQVTTAAHGTKKLDTARLEEMIIPVPPTAMQQAFEANVRRMEAIQQHQIDAAAKAEAAFSALLARAFAAAPADAAVREAEEVES